MRKLELIITKCGDCPYSVSSYNSAKDQCAKLYDGGTESETEWDILRDDCPLSLHIEGQKEIF